MKLLNWSKDGTQKKKWDWNWMECWWLCSKMNQLLLNFVLFVSPTLDNHPTNFKVHYIFISRNSFDAHFMFFLFHSQWIIGFPCFSLVQHFLEIVFQEKKENNQDWWLEQTKKQKEKTWFFMRTTMMEFAFQDATAVCSTPRRCSLSISPSSFPSEFSSDIRRCSRSAQSLWVENSLNAILILQGITFTHTVVTICNKYLVFSCF